MIEPEKRGAGFGIWCSVVFAMILLYVVSTGPVQFFATRWEIPHPFVDGLEAFYAPLIWLYHHNDAAQAAFDWYFELWVL